MEYFDPRVDFRAFNAIFVPYFADLMVRRVDSNAVRSAV